MVSEAASFAVGWFAIDKKDLQELVKQLRGRRVAVFIDDLDRADPRVVPKTLLALRELLDWPGFSFVLAFDKNVIAKALGEYSSAYGENAHVFLEKVVDVPFEVPTPTEAQKELLARHAFAACCAFVPSEALQTVAAYLPNEPRRIKLVARTLGILKDVATRHGPEEVDWTGLTLYHVVHEASPEAAAWLVNAVTSEAGEWTLWALDRKDREEKEKQAAEALRERIKLPGVFADADRVTSAAMHLLKRWEHQDSSRIKYWVNLLLSEPTFTLYEYRSLFEQWLSDKTDTVISGGVMQAARNGATSSGRAARDLLKLAVDEHGEALGAMADSETEQRHRDMSRRANETLSILEHLWTTCGIEEIRQAAESGEGTAPLIAMTSRWIGWTRNPGEADLRQRERRLALLAAERCLDKERLYRNTDPFWEHDFHADAASAANSRAWREELRATLIGPIAERLLGLFSQPGGLVSAARGDEELATWLLESYKSPLYDDVRLAEKLESVFALSAEAGEKAEVVLSENAKLYLQMLLHQARSSSWAGVERLRDIHTRLPRIVPAAWTAVARCRVPFRMVSSILKLRNDLMA